jgi:hypothetical protein
MHPLFTPSLADANSTGRLPTVPEGVEPSQDQNDVAITEHSETDASEGACQRTRIGRSLRPVNTSGKAGAQIPHLPLGDDSSPWGR